MDIGDFKAPGSAVKKRLTNPTGIVKHFTRQLLPYDKRCAQHNHCHDNVE